MGQRKKCRRTGKKKFNTHEQALQRAGELLGLPGAPKFMRAYYCRQCGHYHLTSK